MPVAIARGCAVDYEDSKDDVYSQSAILVQKLTCRLRANPPFGEDLLRLFRFEKKNLHRIRHTLRGIKPPKYPLSSGLSSLHSHFASVSANKTRDMRVG